MNDSYDFLYKLILIGDSGVGKTSLLFRFANNESLKSFTATIGIDNKIRNIVLDGKIIKLQVWDTAGQERYRSITKAYYRGALGIILVYDVTNEISFDNIYTWMSTIEDVDGVNVEKMIIGNKCDMEENRVVPKARGEKLGIEFNAKFIETSAKSGFNVEKAFFDIARHIKSKNDDRAKPVIDRIFINKPSSKNKRKCLQSAC